MSGYHGPYVADDDEARELMTLVTRQEMPAEPAGQEAGMGPGRHDSWAAEQFRLVLEALRWNWGEAYEIGVSAGLWTAVRRDGRGTLEEDGPESLRTAILADYSALPVPRDLPLTEPGEPLG